MHFIAFRSRIKEKHKCGQNFKPIWAEKVEIFLECPAVAHYQRTNNTQIIVRTEKVFVEGQFFNFLKKESSR